MTRKEAINRMTRYLDELALSVPAGVKAAEAVRNRAAATKLAQLSSELKQHGNLIRAVNGVYRGKSAAFRANIVKELLAGCKRAFTQSEQAKQSMHPAQGPMTAGSGRKMLAAQSGPARVTPVSGSQPAASGSGEPGFFRTFMQNYPHYFKSQFGF